MAISITKVEGERPSYYTISVSPIIVVLLQQRMGGYPYNSNGQIPIAARRSVEVDTYLICL